VEKFGPITGEKNDGLQQPYCTFHDSCIRASFAVTDDRIAIKLTNKSKSPVKIVWDKCALKGSGGTTMRVIHEGINYAHKESWQRPTIVLEGKTISDFLLPSIHVNVYSEGSAGWSVLPLVLPENYGKDMNVILALEINGTLVEYAVLLKINPVQ
jgi:hypothetical protein